jgi:hypothetical protein
MFQRRRLGCLDKILVRHEAWFQHKGYVNRQNRRILNAENPQSFHEKPLHSLKVGESCVGSQRRIVAPIISQEE